MNKKDSTEWELKRLRAKPKTKEVRIVCAEVSRDEYVEYLEDKIITLEEKMKEFPVKKKAKMKFNTDLIPF